MNASRGTRLKSTDKQCIVLIHTWTAALQSGQSGNSCEMDEPGKKKTTNWFINSLI